MIIDVWNFVYMLLIFFFELRINFDIKELISDFCLMFEILGKCRLFFVFGLIFEFFYFK